MFDIFHSMLHLGNTALRNGEHLKAVWCYANVLCEAPVLQNIAWDNLRLARGRYRKVRALSKTYQVAVCGWELSHNAAGRVYTLAQLYERFADVEIIGSIFLRYGDVLWEPIQHMEIPVHSFSVDDESQYLRQALMLVARHPYDIVHLSKPRAPNIIIGILYKLLWGAKVFVDVDDEELGFVGATESLDLDGYLKKHQSIPELEQLDGEIWTQLSVSCINQFDGVTVSNSALQRRYGGKIIPHARDENDFIPSVELRVQSRLRFKIAVDSHVVLFFGTPRRHKGLLEVARALSKLNDKQVVFLIVGTFPEKALKNELKMINGVNFHFIENQPYDTIPRIVATADFCLLPLDKKSLAARFQIPAKLSDVLAIGIPTWITPVEAVSDVIESGACFPLDLQTVVSHLRRYIEQADCNERNRVRVMARKYFQEKLSIEVNFFKLKILIASCLDNNESVMLSSFQDQLMKELIKRFKLNE